MYLQNNNRIYLRNKVILRTGDNDEKSYTSDRENQERVVEICEHKMIQSFPGSKYIYIYIYIYRFLQPKL